MSRDRKTQQGFVSQNQSDRKILKQVMNSVNVYKVFNRFFNTNTSGNLGKSKFREWPW